MGLTLKQANDNFGFALADSDTKENRGVRWTIHLFHPSLDRVEFKKRECEVHG